MGEEPDTGWLDASCSRATPVGRDGIVAALALHGGMRATVSLMAETGPGPTGGLGGQAHGDRLDQRQHEQRRLAPQ